MPVCFYLDHCGGLVFGADGRLHFATTRWPEGREVTSPHWGALVSEVVLVATNEHDGVTHISVARGTDNHQVTARVELELLKRRGSHNLRTCRHNATISGFMAMDSDGRTSRVGADG